MIENHHLCAVYAPIYMYMYIYVYVCIYIYTYVTLTVNRGAFLSAPKCRHAVIGRAT